MMFKEPPFVNCPSCGKDQQTVVIKEPFKFDKETWLYELDCECGKRSSFSDYYMGFNKHLSLREWVIEIIKEYR